MSYIRLDRKMLTWEWADDPNMVALWIRILLDANYYENQWHGEIYESGSFPTSIHKLSKETGLSERSVRTCLNKLKSTHEVTIKPTSKGTKIIVNKWAFYQGLSDDCDKQIDKQSDKRATSDRQATDNTIRKKESKESKEVNIYSALDGRSDAFKEAFMEFADMRKRIKKPLTERAVKKTLKDLSVLSSKEDEQIQILDQSTYNYWRGVFPLNHTTARKPEEDKPSSERYKVGW